MNHHDVSFEIKAIDDSGIFTGYGSVYDIVDTGEDIVASGSFTKSLTDWKEKKSFPAMLWQHNQDQPCGVYTKMTEDGKGLLVEGRLALKTQRGAEAYELMKMNAISGLSIGFQSREATYDQKLGIRTITKADLWEVSIVTFPMNEAAKIDSVKSIEQITDLRTAEQYLRESGISKSLSLAFISRIKSLALRDLEQTNEIQRILKSLKDRETGFLSA